MMKVLQSLLPLAFLANKALAQCPPGSQLLELELHFQGDYFTEEDDNAWFLTNLCDDTEVFRTEFVDDFEQAHELYCLNPYQEYRFSLYDWFGDGLTSTGNHGHADGYYTVIWDGEAIVDKVAMFDGNDHMHTVFGNKMCFGTSMMVPLPSGGGGDPHFKTWTGEFFDFHGACDLVFMHSPNYANGLGLDVHVRTTGRYEYSFIETVAIRVGEDILEISAFGEHSFNGIAHMDFPATMGYYSMVTHKKHSEKKHEYEIKLEEDAKIIVTTFKDWVSISVDAKTLDHFRDCVGLVGSTSGKMVGRDGKTTFKDINDYGQEWQVQDMESKLFMNADRFPQFPNKCVMPDVQAVEEGRRKLLEASGITEEDAKSACAKANRPDMSQCVYDVMATSDLEVADAGAF